MTDFSRLSLKIDPDHEAERIMGFLRDMFLTKMRKKGAVIGLSGGIDSAVSAALSVRAFGPEKVLGILLPEKESSLLSEKYALLQAQQLGIRTQKVELTPVLEDLGVYSHRYEIVRKNFPEFDPLTWRYKIVLPPDLLDKDRLNVFSLVVQLPDSSEQKKRLSPDDYLQMVAATNMKQRTRMIYLYYFAEKNNYGVVGTTNRTEERQGFFVKYGDGGVDVEPLAHLYKTQVYELAEYLDVPREIIERPPSPDTYTATVSDTEFYFGAPFDLLDPFMWADEHDVPVAEICEVLSLTPEQYDRLKKNVDRKAAATWHFLETPPTVKT